MVHFPGFARTRLWIHRAVVRFYRTGFPHSVIPGSMPTCGSPRLIAACHDLHRLLLPRHPPCALSSLTTKFTQPTAPCGAPCQVICDPICLLIASPRLLRTVEAPADSKALIKLFLTLRLVITQCYSVVKNHPPCGVPPRWVRVVANPMFGAKRLASLLTSNIWLETIFAAGPDRCRVRFSRSAPGAEESPL